LGEEDDDDPNLGPSEPDACYFELIDPATGVTYVPRVHRAFVAFVDRMTSVCLLFPPCCASRCVQ
jgi:hypothetical protein